MKLSAALSRLRCALIRAVVLSLTFAAPASALLASVHGPAVFDPEAHAAEAAQNPGHGHSHAIDDDVDQLPAHTHHHNPADHFHEAAGPVTLGAERLRPAAGPVDSGPDARPESGPGHALERPPRR